MGCGDAACRAERHHLLLNSWLITIRNALETFLIARFVRREDATLNALRQGIDAIRHGRPEKSLGIEFHVLVRLTLEIE